MHEKDLQCEFQDNKEIIGSIDEETKKISCGHFNGDETPFECVDYGNSKYREFPRPRLIDLAREYEEAITAIEDLDEVTDDDIKDFRDMELGVQWKVDRCLARLAFMESQLVAYQAERDFWCRKVSAASNLLSKYKAYLLSCCDLANAPLRGSLKSLHAQKNSQPTMEYKHKFPSKSLSKTVSWEDVEFGHIPMEYTKEVTERVIDTEKVKHSLQNGEKLAFVELKHGKHLRVR